MLHNARDAKEKLAVAKATEEVVAAIMALGQKRPALGSALVDCICSNAAAKAIAHKYLIHPSVLSYWSRRLGLPDRVITDNGGEFSVFDFELLAARYEMAIWKRPPAKPRFGGRHRADVCVYQHPACFTNFGETHRRLRQTRAR